VRAPGRGSPPRHFDEVMEECIRFVDAFRHTRTNQTIAIPDIERRKNNRTQGKGHTGREEWT